MVDGVWIEKPDPVKREFVHHFSSRFDKPSVKGACIDMCYPNLLTIEQQEDLEHYVSKEELKRAVPISLIGSVYKIIAKILSKLGLLTLFVRFHLYGVKTYNYGKVYWIRVKELDALFLNFQEDDQDDISSDAESQEGDVANKADNNESDADRVSKSSFMHENDTAHKDVNSCKKREKSKVGGSILDLMDELVTVDQTMGYNMAGLGNKAKRRWIKELC
nr:RNA-directed DNA polymerase, eukaryota [Tanacetum cinerariifolium]